MANYHNITDCVIQGKRSYAYTIKVPGSLAALTLLIIPVLAQAGIIIYIACFGENMFNLNCSRKTANAQSCCLYEAAEKERTGYARDY